MALTQEQLNEALDTAIEAMEKIINSDDASVNEKSEAAGILGELIKERLRNE